MLIKATINGPFEVTGPAKIEDAGGQVKELKDGEKAWLCRCGASKINLFATARTLKSDSRQISNDCSFGKYPELVEYRGDFTDSRVFWN